MDSGEYTIDIKGANQITVTYLGGAANATVVSGTALLDGSGNVLFEYQTNPSTDEFIHLFQAENFAIILQSQHKTIIYDGSSSRQAVTGELPPAFIGIYAWGRIWLTIFDRRTFLAGDIVYGPSGTPAYQGRDAILKVTENDFLNEGGKFAVPNNAGPITCMTALATQDTSLGIGPILVGTTNSVISVNAPVDRTTWKNLTFPIQTISLIDYGPMGPRYIASVNGDWWFRALNEIRSFIVARRDINVWGNTPVSNEVTPILDLDSRDLLFFGSNMLFDNKLFTTVSPHRTDQGILHRGMVVINYDLVSDLRSKAPPAWEGVYSGLEICQLVKGRIDGIERGFMIVMDGDDMQFWEILKDGQGYYDQFSEQVSVGEVNLTRTSIQPYLETRRDNFGDGTQLKILYTAELFLDELVDEVQLTIKYRPDQYPSWITWQTINLCATVSQCTLTAPGAFSCSIWKEKQKQYAARIMLVSPGEACNVLGGMPLNWGHSFRFRIEGIGHFRIRGFKPHAIPQTDKQEGDCSTTPECKSFPDCNLPLFDYNSHGT